MLELRNDVDSGGPIARSGRRFRQRSRVPSLYAPLPTSETVIKCSMSADDLSTQLGALITSARASGLDAAIIVQALRDELEFAAELAHAGRHFCVQLIDLGPQESAILQRPVRDRRAMIQTRSVN